LDQRLNELHAPLQNACASHETVWLTWKRRSPPGRGEPGVKFKAKDRDDRKQLETERAKNDLQFN